MALEQNLEVIEVFPGERAGDGEKSREWESRQDKTSAKQTKQTEK